MPSWEIEPAYVVRRSQQRRATKWARNAWLGKGRPALRHSCFAYCRPLGNCACVAFLFAWEGAAVTRPIPLKGGKWHARPARPESSEGLAFSEARGAICASAAVDIRGVQGVHRPGPEAKRAASAQSEFAPLAGSFAPRRARTSLGSWARASLSSLNWKVSFGPTGPSWDWLFEQGGALCVKGRLPVGCARCQVPRDHEFEASPNQTDAAPHIWVCPLV